MLYYNPHTKELFNKSEDFNQVALKSTTKPLLYPYRIERDMDSLADIQLSLGMLIEQQNQLEQKSKETQESNISGPAVFTFKAIDVENPRIGWRTYGEPELQDDGTYIQKLIAYDILYPLKMQAVEGIPILIKEQLIQRMGVGNIDFTLGQAILDKLVAAKALLTTPDATTIITTDNGRHTVTADDIDDILEAINAYKQYIYDTADEYRTQLLSANSIEELNAVPNPFTTIAKYGTV